MRADGEGEAARVGVDAEAMAFWREMERPGPDSVTLQGIVIRRGSRVRLKPRPGGDIMDLALAGRIGIVEGIDQDENHDVHITVALEDDPGRDLGLARVPGHRFFFRPDEVEPVAPSPRVLVAGIGNIFLGDDGFGCEVARRFAGRPQPDGVVVRDFGIRGMDLAYELARYDVVVLVDAAPRGGAPGTLYVIDAATSADGPVGVETHGMDPVRVLAFARALGPLPARILVVGCEPGYVPPPDSDAVVSELTAPVRAAVSRALDTLGALVAEITQPVADAGDAGTSARSEMEAR